MGAKYLHLMLVGPLQNTLDLALTVAPWLVIGLALAGVVRVLVPDAALYRWLGGSGIAPVARAAVIGAPLPLCSCGAIPTAFSLYRSGASPGASTAFLVGTPGIGMDSLVLTWALLGPFMAVARGVGAVATAVATGVAVAQVPPRESSAEEARAACGASCCEQSPAPRARRPRRILRQVGATVTELLDDIGAWLLLGVALAGLLMSLVPPGSLAVWGGGITAMIALALVGVPLYVCATAATPVAVGMLAAGVSPGAVLVFLIAGPVTSLATLLVLRREMGWHVVAIYLAAIVLSAIAVGLAVDGLVAVAGVEVSPYTGERAGLWGAGVEWAALAVLLGAGVPPLRRTLAAGVRRLAPRP